MVADATCVQILVHQLVLKFVKIVVVLFVVMYVVLYALKDVRVFVVQVVV